MATRVPLFFSSDYSSEEFANTDDVVFGKVVLGGVSGVVLDGGGLLAQNFGAPVDPDDLANKAYVDAVASGLDVHESVMAKTDAELTGYVAVGSGVGKTLEAPTSTSAANTIDGRLLEVGDRVLVSQQGGDDATADVDNGIYDVTTLGDDGSVKFLLTRATEEDTGAELHQGVYVFVSWGTVNSDTGWTMVTADPITLDTTPIKFSQFSGAAQLTFDQGLKKLISSVQVELDSDADAAGAGAGGGTSGLEFDADTASGQLRAAVKPTGGITRQTGGLGINLDGSTAALDVGGAGTGLSVKGVPNLFEIGGVATSQTPSTGVVTATNLNTLTAGSSSNADSLHTHASSPATEAPLIETDWIAGTAGVTQYYPVYVDATSEAVSNGDTDTDTKCAVIGIAATTEASTAAVAVDSVGLKTGALTGLGFAAGDRIYLKTGGGLHNAAPGGGKRVIEMGFAKNATDLFLKIVDRGRRAA